MFTEFNTLTIDYMPAISPQFVRPIKFHLLSVGKHVTHFFLAIFFSH